MYTLYMYMYINFNCIVHVQVCVGLSTVLFVLYNGILYSVYILTTCNHYTVT